MFKEKIKDVLEEMQLEIRENGNFYEMYNNEIFIKVRKLSNEEYEIDTVKINLEDFSNKFKKIKFPKMSISSESDFDFVVKTFRTIRKYLNRFNNFIV